MIQPSETSERKSVRKTKQQRKIWKIQKRLGGSLMMRWLNRTSLTFTVASVFFNERGKASLLYQQTHFWSIVFQRRHFVVTLYWNTAYNKLSIFPPMGNIVYIWKRKDIYHTTDSIRNGQTFCCLTSLLPLN